MYFPSDIISAGNAAGLFTFGLGGWAVYVGNGSISECTPYGDERVAEERHDHGSTNAGDLAINASLSNFTGVT